MTIAELRVGAFLTKGKRRATPPAYVDDVIATVPTVDYDLDVSKAHADLLVEVRVQGKPRGAHDLLIAATPWSTATPFMQAPAHAFLRRS